MKVIEFIEQFQKRYPNEARYEGATDEMIATYEETLGFRLPVSFVEFLKKFSNGIFLLMSEPIGGVSKESDCGDICSVHGILPRVPDEVLIVETNEWVESNRLISFTMYDAGEVSNNHWVFLCEDGVPDHEYKVGFITQTNPPRIIKVLDNFEEWLTIFWNYNGGEVERHEPVFHILIPSYDERVETIYDGLD